MEHSTNKSPSRAPEAAGLTVHKPPADFSTQDSCSAYKDRHCRRRSRHKPYDPVDDLNLSRLTIASTKYFLSDKSRKTKLDIVKEKDVRSHQANIPLIYPSKLRIHAQLEVGSVTLPPKILSNKTKTDFASLAASASTSDHSKYSTSFSKWSSLREARPVCPTNSTSTHLSPDNSSLVMKDGNCDGERDADELSSLTLFSTSAIGIEQGTSTVTQRHSPSSTRLVRSCSQEAMLNETDFTAEELASYFEELVYIPKKMSEMAEMMYT